MKSIPAIVLNENILHRKGKAYALGKSLMSALDLLSINIASQYGKSVEMKLISEMVPLLGGSFCPAAALVARTAYKAPEILLNGRSFGTPSLKNLSDSSLVFSASCS